MNIVKIFYDLETTGTDARKHGIHQIAGIVEVNDEITETFDIRTRPHSKAVCDPGAMKVCGVTEEEIRKYPPMAVAHAKLIQILSKYVERFNPKNKAWMAGFNNRAFDDIFLRAWFEQNGDTYFGSWFWSDSLDVLSLASEYLIDRRVQMSSFKLKRVAKELGIIVEEERLHEAGYDVHLTREIYRIVTGREIEL